MIFSDLIINNNNWEHLCNAFKNDRLPHAILFHGREGMGKEAHALELAALLNCKNFIVGPTSFHWWPAWLNSRENSIIIRPKDIDISNNSDFWPNKWISI